MYSHNSINRNYVPLYLLIKLLDVELLQILGYGCIKKNIPNFHVKGN
jgi:hypothetical protein